MPTGYQLSDGRDLEVIFAPIAAGMNQHPAVGYVVPDGRDLAQLFAPLAYGSQGHAVGFQLSDGRDLNQIFAWANSTFTTPDFNGRSYSEIFNAQTGQTGNISAFCRMTINGDGTWIVTGGRTGQSATTKGSGNLYSGGPSGWEYRLYDSRGNDTGWRSATTAGSLDVSATVRADSGNISEASATVYFQARRAGQSAAAVTASCVISAEARGWA